MSIKGFIYNDFSVEIPLYYKKIGYLPLSDSTYGNLQSVLDDFNRIPIAGDVFDVVAETSEGTYVLWKLKVVSFEAQTYDNNGTQDIIYILKKSYISSVSLSNNSSETISYSSGEGISIDDNNIISVNTATEKTVGGLRIWQEDGYLCLSTQLYYAFDNIQTENTLTISGSVDAKVENSGLVIN